MKIPDEVIACLERHRGPPSWQAKHPLSEYLSSLTPGCKVDAYITAYGIYFANLGNEHPRKGLLSATILMFREAFAYADYTGETMFARPGEPEDSVEYRWRLLRAYARAGAAFDTRSGFCVYPPERATNGYQLLDKTPGKWLGVL
jgi:hypothetical protein